jgi:hypothetical protein
MALFQKLVRYALEPLHAHCSNYAELGSLTPFHLLIPLAGEVVELEGKNFGIEERVSYGVPVAEISMFAEAGEFLAGERVEGRFANSSIFHDAEVLRDNHDGTYEVRYASAIVDKRASFIRKRNEVPAKSYTYSIPIEDSSRQQKPPSDGGWFSSYNVLRPNSLSAELLKGKIQQLRAPSPFRFARPSSAPKCYVPTRDGLISGKTGSRTYVPSMQGPLSGKTSMGAFVTGSRLSPSDQMKKLRQDAEKRRVVIQTGIDTETVERGLAKEWCRIKTEQRELAELNSNREDQITAKAKKETKNELKVARRWRLKNKAAEYKARVKAKEKLKIDAKKAKVKAKEEAKKNAADAGARKATKEYAGSDDESDDDDSESEESSDKEDAAERLEEEAMERAKEGQFVVDVCVVSASGLPKVDNWSTIDCEYLFLFAICLVIQLLTSPFRQLTSSPRGMDMKTRTATRTSKDALLTEYGKYYARWSEFKFHALTGLL